MEFAVAVLNLCERIPTRSGAGLVSQLRRAAVSVPSNIAEGYDRPKAEYANYLRVARGSLREAETQLELLLRLSLAPTNRIISILGAADELGRIIHGVKRSAERASAR
jgi:four helix bundle protein